MNRKKALFTLITVAMTGGLAFGLGEVLVRLFSPQFTYSELHDWAGNYYASSEFIPFTLRPGYRGMQLYHGPEEHVPVTTNALGLRGREITAAKPEGSRRVLIVGDSYTFGVFVRDGETYSAVLERLLRADGRNVEVLNAGYAGGWGPDTQYAWLSNVGFELQPDLVVYGLFAGNDVEDIQPQNWLERDGRGLPVKIDDPNLSVDEQGWLRAKYPAYHTTYGERWLFRTPLLRESHLLVLLSRQLTPSVFDRGGDHPEFFRLYLDPELDDYLGEREERLRELVAGMHELAASHGAAFMVLMIPANLQVEPETFLAEGEVFQRNYHELLKPWLDERGILYLDVLEAMLGEPGEYFPRDGEVHFNPEGHAFTAAKLADFLAEHELP